METLCGRTENRQSNRKVWNAQDEHFLLVCKIELETLAHLFYKCQDLDHVRKTIEGVIKMGTAHGLNLTRIVLGA